MKERKIKSIPRTQAEAEKLLAEEEGLTYPQAGMPDLKAIAQIFGLTPDLLHPEINPDKSKKEGGNGKGKVRQAISEGYVYAKNDKAGAHGKHKEYGADVD